ncbi:MAG TPA: peptidylprolyl isomerase [Salegentibacter sp.]|uniref:peptidylprolyl isomerase n=1 Tax=Salegentibacter sp. TaxID=1903072 RepID=UPI002F92232A
MIRILSVFSFALILIFSSCEDKQSSSKSNMEPAQDTLENTQTKVDSIKLALEKKSHKNLPEEEGVTSIDFPIEQEELIPTLMEYGKQNPETRIRIITNFGDIEVSLYKDTPLHRANFIMLTKDHYFDHTYIYRVAPNFVIQGGNSDNWATSRHRSKIGSYLIPNEFDAGYRHVRGAFSAAKYSEQNVSKASSPFEFFIVTKSDGAHHLDNDHTVFGRVTKGMDVADEISKVKTGQSEWPIDNIEIDVEIIE